MSFNAAPMMLSVENIFLQYFIIGVVYLLRSRSRDFNRDMTDLTLRVDCSQHAVNPILSASPFVSKSSPVACNR
jgi:hypothetical protein